VAACFCVKKSVTTLKAGRSNTEFSLYEENVVIQPRTQNESYWGPNFALTNTDIEQIYNHFLEVERPQTADEIARMIIAYRVAEEANAVKKKLSGRTIYQPQNSYEVGAQLVFPALQFAHGDVTAVRDGYNPHDGQFKVITVGLDDENREFAAQLQSDHVLNATQGNALAELVQVDVDDLVLRYGGRVKTAVAQELKDRAEFVKLGDVWFVKQLMAEVNAGHLHLAEAVLEISDGGPLPTAEIVPQLDMDPRPGAVGAALFVKLPPAEPMPALMKWRLRATWPGSCAVWSRKKCKKRPTGCSTSPSRTTGRCSARSCCCWSVSWTMSGPMCPNQPRRSQWSSPCSSPIAMPGSFR
jgi:hypothetical protein